MRRDAALQIAPTMLADFAFSRATRSVLPEAASVSLNSSSMKWVLLALKNFTGPKPSASLAPTIAVANTRSPSPAGVQPSRLLLSISTSWARSGIQSKLSAV